MPYHQQLYFEQEGDGRPLLFLHPPGLSGLYWRPILDRLAGRFQAITLDLPGHGRSGGREHPWSYAPVADQLAELADHLNLPAPPDPLAPILVGYSSAATIALLAASRAPHRWAGVVGVSVPTPATTPDIALKVRGGELLLRLGLSAWIGKQILRTNYVDRAHYQLVLPHALSVAPTALTAFFHEIRRWDPLTFAPQIRAPVLLVNGAKDRWLLPYARQLQARLPQALLWLHPKADHRVITREPDRFAAELVAFTTLDSDAIGKFRTVTQ
ncbi:MAG TPA: alpha/beta hydrolase [Symbiobacteriaceae bacterium]|nr:alpha/beta hydrolase [Symbiobacteriaceae bacterium]